MADQAGMAVKNTDISFATARNDRPFGLTRTLRQPSFLHCHIEMLDESYPLTVCQPIPLVLLRRPHYLAEVAEYRFSRREIRSVECVLQDFPDWRLPLSSFLKLFTGTITTKPKPDNAQLPRISHMAVFSRLFVPH